MKGNLKRPDFRELMNPLLRTTAGILFFSWFFYRSVFAVILFIFPGILYFRKCVREQREKKRWELTVQFKECLLAVANSLRTGYAVENAFLESREDIRLLFGERSAMYGELELIRRGMIVNITLEELIGDLAERSGCEEIQQFSTILSVAKRGGGNVSQIIRNTAELISDKVETTQEMMTLLQGRCLEQRVMEVMPFAISFYIGVTYPGYFASLYHNITGYIIMTACLAIYLCAYIVGEKIMERIGESL
ncbi:MAG: type II secretion system F family protein [Waltera sp.]